MNPIINGDFESDGGWSTEKIGKASSTTVNMKAADNAYSGSYYCKLSNNLKPTVDREERAAFVRQTVDIPVNALSLRYAVKYWKDTYGPLMGVLFGTEVLDVLGVGGKESSSDWSVKSFDITSFREKAVTLELFLDDRHGEWSGNTDHGGWFGVDEIVIWDGTVNMISIPPGAKMLVDGTDTGKKTPDTITI